MENRNNRNEIKQHPDYQQELISIIRSNLPPKALKEKLLDYHENDIAAVLELLSKDERMKIYNILDPETISDILEYADDYGVYFKELGIKKQAEVLSETEADSAAEYLKQLGKAERKTLIDLMDDESKKSVLLVASFDDDEIGSRMTTNFIRIQEGISIKDAMRELVEQAAENDNVSTIYTVDKNNEFYGAIDLKDLIIARQDADLDDIILTSYPYVYADEQIDDCVERIKDYSEDSIPVLDSRNKLIGVITSQNIVEMVDEALGEDYAKLAGLSSEEDIKEPIKKSVRKRLPWLIILLGLGMIVSSVVGLFENIVAQLTVLVCFQSLVLDMAGNVGTQSLAVTIRVLTNDNLKLSEKLGLIAKETKTGFTNGILLAVASFIFIGFYIYLFKQHDLTFAFAVSACIGAAMLISMVLSSVSGTAIPMIFKKLKIDPAVASGPLITTINDLVAATSYYGLAWIFLLQIMKF